MKEKLLALLQALEAVVPPGEHCHHSICVGFDRLALFVRRGEEWIPFFLDEGDLERGVDLVPEILRTFDAIDQARGLLR